LLFITVVVAVTRPNGFHVRRALRTAANLGLSSINVFSYITASASRYKITAVFLASSVPVTPIVDIAS